MEPSSDNGDKGAAGNPNPNPTIAGDADSAQASLTPLRRATRAPFTSLSQVESDQALARALQEQERAYMMLRMNGGDEGSDYASSEADSLAYEDEDEDEDEELEGAIEDDAEEDEDEDEYDDDDDDGDNDEDHPIEGEESAEGSDYGEDAFDANDHPLDPADFDCDESYARALQEAEEQEVAARLMALTGFSDWRVEDHGDHGSNSQDAWEDVDPDELSYEELIALGEVVGTESRGLTADTIASLTSIKYKAQGVQDENTDQCVICRLEYEDGDSLVVLSCKHIYHPECINKWLQINKVCPVCSSEVSTSEHKED